MYRSECAKINVFPSINGKEGKGMAYCHIGLSVLLKFHISDKGKGQLKISGRAIFEKKKINVICWY